MTQTRSIVLPAPQTPTQRDTVPLSRFALAWAVLLGGLVGFWLVRPWFSAVVWGDGTCLVLFATSKIATLLCMPAEDRRRLGWGRFVAYLFWPGMRPGQFLPERKPAEVRPAPSLTGLLLNAVAAVAFLWVIPALMPLDWPVAFRVASGFTGWIFLIMFVVFDAWALLYRACGIGVEKLWHCPAAATSLADFWGQRWNRIFSGMFREVLFLPLARRYGTSLALAAVFLYSGLLHENFSVTAGSGYGMPLVYFVIQGVGTWLEGRSGLRRACKRWPLLGRLWTAAVVLGPVLLLFHDASVQAYSVPKLVGLGVPGL